MHRKLSQARIVNDLSEVITQKLVGKCKRYLHSLPAMLSGDNSGLANVWDELCVQVQGEHSYYWDAYLETIDDFLRWPVDELPAYQLCVFRRT